MRCRAVALLAVVAVLAVSACGVPTDGEARRLAPDQVPFNLTATTTPGDVTTVAPTTTVVAGSAVILYYVIESGLRAVPVSVEPVPDLLGIMDLLAQDPPESTSARTVLRPGEVVSIEQDPENDGRRIVDVDPALVQLPGSEQVLAVGQIVLTLTDRPGIRSITFTSNGEPLSVPRADGSIIDGPARRVDFIDLIG